MTTAEIHTFIETMEEVGDVWTPEQVEEVYGTSTLQDAIAERRSTVSKFANIIGAVLNR